MATNDKVTLFHSPNTRSSGALTLLEELGEPYDLHVLDMKAGEQRQPGYLAVNPMGKVPAIRHGDVVVTECAAICAYLAGAFPQAGLAPRDDRERGPYYRWMFFAAGPVEAASTNKSLGVVPPPERKGSVGYGSLEEVVAALELAISGREYVCGDRFTAADVYVGSHIGWGMRFGTFEKRPAFESYVGRLFGRPAAVRAREIDDALLAERQQQQQSKA